MVPRRLAPLGLAALCVAGSAAQAETGSRLFQVRLQVLSACQVVAEVPSHGRAAPPALAVRCSRGTPFAIGWGTSERPRILGTGAGMEARTEWPMQEASVGHLDMADAIHDVGTIVHVDY